VVEFTNPERDRLFRTILAEVQHDEELSRELVDRLLRPQFDATLDRIRNAQLAVEIGADDRHGAAVRALLHRWLRASRVDPKVA
jgi:hypothetical protein